MRRSECFLPARKEAPDVGAAAARRLVRAGLVRSFGSGLWGFTPAGLRVRRKVAGRIRTAMEAVGGQAVALPDLQYADRWEQSGRYGQFEGEMFALENRDGRAMCLAPSHEEAAVHLVDGRIRSYDDLPLLVHQVGAKFRDDHASDGLVRSKAFAMADAYSFHLDGESLAATYREVRAACERALADLGVEFAVVEAEAGVMGGSTSEEFLAPVAGGGDRLVYCPECRFGVTDERDGFGRHDAGEDCPECGARLLASDAVEVGHIFRLGTRYAGPMGLTVDDRTGRERAVEMGSYGIGVDRLLQTLAVQDGDAAEDDGAGNGPVDDDGSGNGTADGDGCRWPVTGWGCVAPYRAAVVPVGYEGEVRSVADRLHEACGPGDVLLFDDRSRSVGERFAEADLLGIPATVVVGDRYRETGLVDLETRDGRTSQFDPADVPAAVERFAAGSG